MQRTLQVRIRDGNSKGDLSKTGRLKFLTDTGAEISVVKVTSLKPGFSYEFTKGVNIRGISNSLLKTEGPTTLKLFTQTHVFHVMGGNFNCQYDGILGQDSWKNNRATINYCDHTITKDDAIINFDNEADQEKDMTHKLTLKNRTESIVQLPTNSKGLGVISKREIIPGVYLAETLTEEINGYCITSVVNALERDITIDYPPVELKEIQDKCDDAVLIFPSLEVGNSNRLSELRDELRTGHLSNEENVSIIKICEEFNDIFYLTSDTLTSTPATEHTIPTPTIYPTRGINMKPYGIPEIHREEV